jgi:hypothetical protein
VQVDPLQMFDSGQSEEISLFSMTFRKTVAITEALYRQPSLKVKSICRHNLWGHQCGFDVRDRPLIRVFALVKYLRKNGSIMVYHITSIFLRSEVLYNTITEFDLPTKIVRPIKMCLTGPELKTVHVNICVIYFLFEMI